jgi:hypothetical protein
MGYYINEINGESLPATGKAQFLIKNGATRVTDLVFQENLVCVVENLMFDAAGYAFSKNEMDAFNDPNDYRRKTWLIVPNAKFYPVTKKINNTLNKKILSFLFFSFGIFTLGGFYTKEYQFHQSVELWEWYTMIFLTWYFLVHFLNNVNKQKDDLQ